MFSPVTLHDDPDEYVQKVAAAMAALPRTPTGHLAHSSDRPYMGVPVAAPRPPPRLPSVDFDSDFDGGVAVRPLDVEEAKAVLAVLPHVSIHSFNGVVTAVRHMEHAFGCDHCLRSVNPRDQCLRCTTCHGLACMDCRRARPRSVVACLGHGVFAMVEPSCRLTYPRACDLCDQHIGRLGSYVEWTASDDPSDSKDTMDVCLDCAAAERGRRAIKSWGLVFRSPEAMLGGNETCVTGFGPLLDWVPAYTTNLRFSIFVSVNPAQHGSTVIMSLAKDMALAFRKLEVPVHEVLQALQGAKADAIPDILIRDTQIVSVK